MKGLSFPPAWALSVTIDPHPQLEGPAWTLITKERRYPPAQIPNPCPAVRQAEPSLCQWFQWVQGPAGAGAGQCRRLWGWCHLCWRQGCLWDPVRPLIFKRGLCFCTHSYTPADVGPGSAWCLGIALIVLPFHKISLTCMLCVHIFCVCLV